MPPSEPQRLPTRLAPLAEVLARIDVLARPVEAREIDVAAAAGRVLAAEVAVEQSLPAAAIALRDGWAVRSDLVSDAGPYAPVALTPPPTLVEVGAPLPPEADAVLPPDAVTMHGGERLPFANKDGTYATITSSMGTPICCATGVQMSTPSASVSMDRIRA